MKSTKIFALLLVVVMCFSAFTSCFLFPEEKPNDNTDVAKTYTYNTYTALSPSNWNELTYQDNNDTQIMNYIASSFFEYDYKYDENGNIISGAYVMKYAAVEKLEDVSATVDAKWGIPEGGTGYAYKFTLRNDLKWQNGDKITAHDFVYTMQQLLDPAFQNYRADTVYNGSTVIVNAQNYLKQGSKQWTSSTIYVNYDESLDSKLVFTLAAPVSADPDKGIEAKPQVAMRDSMGFPASYDAKACAAHLISNYLSNTAFTAETAAAMEGKTLAEIKADPTLAAAWAALIGWWQTEPNEEFHFFITNYEFPEMTMEEVGYYAASDYELVMILAQPLPLLDAEGNLTYHVAYDLGSMPLVHKDTYEKTKVAPKEGSDLWTSIYNSTVSTTMSWGPYKLESFQSGKQYTLVRNDQWYGYGLEENKGLYQTDRIVCDTIKEWSSAWVKFQAGEIDDIGIDVTIADDYKGSDRAFFTPDDFVASLQLQSSKEQLKARESEGINKTLLAYDDFRKALSLSINRADFAAKTTTSSLAGFGLFNSMHYLDVANGVAYRQTDEAKMVLCETYGVDISKYESLDAAVASITGYNLELAKQLVEKAYAEALAAGEIKATDKVEILMGSGAINEVVTRRYNYIKEAWIKLVEGTSLEGRLVFPDYYDGAENWADDFKAGKYDVCMGGWQGAAWNPGYFLAAYLLPVNMFSAAWDTANEMMTFTMKGVGPNGEDITDTLSLVDWYDCLNSADAKYDFTSNALPESLRCQLIAALEKAVLTKYYSVPLYNNFGAALMSYKVDYITYEYNTFMGYGGIKYMTYNYDDAAWAAAVAEQDGQLNYK